MTNMQRMRSDMATIDKREIADKILHDNRDRNDALTQERRFEADMTADHEDKRISDKREKNDELTADRRFEADKTMNENRDKNDEITANRREMKDGPNNVLAISLVVLLLLAVGTLLIFV